MSFIEKTKIIVSIWAVLQNASGTLYEHLGEVDSRAETMFHDIVKSLAEKEKVTETLKANSPFEWICKMNNIRNRAMEIVVDEVFRA